MKRLIQKLIHRSLNSLMGGASLPLCVNHVIAIEGKKEMSNKTIELPFGKGKITYRVPNVVEQLRFHAAARWYDKEVMYNGSLRAAAAIEVIDPFIVSIEGAYSTMDQVREDRKNTDVLIDIAFDIAGKQISDDEKKL
jgi:hypothetical protein